MQWCWCEWTCQTSIQLCSLQFKQSGWHFFSLSKAFTLSFSPDLLIWELLERKYRETLQCFSFSCCNWEMITAVLSELHDRWSHWTHSESTRKLFGIISYFYSTFRKKKQKKPCSLNMHVFCPSAVFWKILKRLTVSARSDLSQLQLRHISCRWCVDGKEKQSAVMFIRRSFNVRHTGDLS